MSIPVFAPGKSLTSDGTPVSGQIPADSAGCLPLFVRVTATAAGYFRISNDASSAVVGDALIQPSDSLILKTCGLSWFSFVSHSGSSTVTVTPIDVGGVAYPNGFNPLSFFLASEQGAWYDPSDLTTLFQDAAGTTPVTAVEQPVGLMKDKSGRGNHAFQTTSANRPVLSGRVNQFVSTETLATQTVTTRATTQTLRFTGSGSITLSGTATGTYTAGTYTFATTAGTLTATVSGTVTQADLRESNTGVNLPAYQRVGNTDTDYDTAGFPLYLKCNGTNTAMQTNSIDFTGTDKMTVWAGVRKLGTATAVQIELSGDANALNGAFGVNGPDGGNDFAFASRGTTVIKVYGGATYPSPTTNILTGIGAISTPVSTLRVNGTQVSTNTSSQGTGTYGNYPLYLFARVGTWFCFNGQFYGAIIRGAQSSAAEIANAEAWLNQKTKAY